MYDLGRFTLSDMIRCNSYLRKFGEGAHSMEEVAQRIVRYIADNAMDGRTGERACSLVRFYKMHPYAELPPALQAIARERLEGRAFSPSLRCLTLLATAGMVPEWNDRRQSRGHQAIPLIDSAMIARAPMIAGLIREFGMELEQVVNPASTVGPHEMQQSQFNVFFVPKALGSAAVPAQEDFVIPHRIESVLGFGGMLHTGDIFATILFTRVPIQPETAEMFKTLALSVKLSVLPFARTVFA